MIRGVRVTSPARPRRRATLSLRLTAWAGPGESKLRSSRGPNSQTTSGDVCAESANGEVIALALIPSASFDEGFYEAEAESKPPFEATCRKWRIVLR